MLLNCRVWQYNYWRHVLYIDNDIFMFSWKNFINFSVKRRGKHDTVQNIYLERISQIRFYAQKIRKSKYL
jgi:hypothetical protein